MEQVDASGKPLQWKQGSSVAQAKFYTITADSSIKHNGKYSLRITGTDENNVYGNAYIQVPAPYIGNRVILSGFLRTQNVDHGFAGLFLALFNDSQTLQYDNMQNRGVKGTEDWQKFSITLPFSAEVVRINLGALISGGGTVWVDDLSLELDGKPIEQAPKRKIFQAELDTVFNSGSGIAAISANPKNTEALTALGEVWSFLKYHHPAIASGNYNWDAELIRVIPKITEAKNKKEWVNVLEHWLDGFPKPDSCRTCSPYKKSADIKLEPDYGPIFTAGYLSVSLQEKLKYILRNHTGSSQYYLDMQNGVGNPIIKNEKPYILMQYPDAGFRLLALFRYWALIQYFFPDKQLIGEDWNTVLGEQVPIFLNAKNATDYSLACLKLIARIHDTHANIWGYNLALDEYRGNYFAPFSVKFIEEKLVVDKLKIDSAELLAKISHGDIITNINGRVVEDIVKEQLSLTPASNLATQFRDMPNYILRGNTNQITVTVLHNNVSQEISLPRYTIRKINEEDPYPELKNSYKLINGDIGYVYPAKYKNEYLPEIKQAFENTKGIIIDMRCYPSDFMPFTFGSYIKNFLSPFVIFTYGSLLYPGLFTCNTPLFNGKGSSDNYKNKVVVIVNETTQSQAEYTTMAFQSSSNVTVIGSTTAGADGNISQFALPGGINTVFSGIGVLYPDKTETQRTGVKIDVSIKPTIKGFREGKDELLEKAISIINQK